MQYCCEQMRWCAVAPYALLLLLLGWTAWLALRADVYDDGAVLRVPGRTVVSGALAAPHPSHAPEFERRTETLLVAITYWVDSTTKYHYDNNLPGGRRRCSRRDPSVRLLALEHILQVLSSYTVDVTVILLTNAPVPELSPLTAQQVVVPKPSCSEAKQHGHCMPWEALRALRESTGPDLVPQHD
eukprot:COSAG06_NODE_21125_length_768_cov_1.632287_2_plen_184_part_01